VKGQSSRLDIAPLGQDLREGVGPLTALMFKSGLGSRVVASSVESLAWGASVVAGWMVGQKRITQWAEDNPSAIGVVWVKK